MDRTAGAILLVIALILSSYFPFSFAQSTQVTLHEPLVKTADQEDVLKQVRLISQVAISVVLENPGPFSIPYVLIVEVRDRDDGITVYLQYEESILTTLDSDVDVSWIPRERGQFYIRAFVISEWSNPVVLAPVVQSEITVGFTEVLAELPEVPIPQVSPGEKSKQNLGNLTLIQLEEYMLDLINADREKYGIAPVKLSDNMAAQKHADDLYESGYNSTHWTTDGMKPYMRYTLFGGKGDVSQNVHAGHIYSPETIVSCEEGTTYCPIIDMTEMLELSEYAMMYDDKECCENGHRDNILDPHHTHVSIGIAYNDYYFAIVQNFENNYVEYSLLSSDKAGYVKMSGAMQDVLPTGVHVYYDEYPTHSIYLRDRDRNSYDNGEYVAAVVEPLPPGYRYPASSEYYIFEADRWHMEADSFTIEFSLGQLMEKLERGVYTIALFAEDNKGDEFPVTSYSIFKE